MTDKVQKILSEIATRKLCTMDEHMAFYNDKAKEDYRLLSEIEELIKALQEEPISNPIDFEKELYKAFGQVKDFTLGMRIAKLFYDMGKNSQEPVSIWHDASEPPIIDKTFLLVAPNGNSSLCLWGGKELHSVTIGGGHSVLCKGDIYSYIDDLLNLDNSCNFGKNLQEEPVSKDYRERYKNIAQSDAFQIVYQNKSLGEVMSVEGKEPVSEDLEKIVEEIAEPTILNAYGTKELARRLRNTICGTSVSEVFEVEVDKYLKCHFTIDKEQLDRFGIEEKDYMYSMDKSDILALVEYFTNWQKTKDESTTEDLGEYINELSKQFPEVSFAKLSRIAVRVAKWQKEQIKEALLSEVLPCFMHGGEADEVVAKLDEVLNQNK